MGKVKNIKRTRHGSPADIARLDFHDWHGNLIDRTKAKVSEKDKGAMLVEKITNSFGITLEFVRRRIDEWNIEALTPTEFPEDQKDKWTRDERGNIVSPFRSNTWKDNE